VDAGWSSEDLPAFLLLDMLPDACGFDSSCNRAIAFTTTLSADFRCGLRDVLARVLRENNIT
jgi:hypothetical protein